MGWLFSPKIQIIHFFSLTYSHNWSHWSHCLEWNVGDQRWLNSTQLTGNDSIVKTRQMEILMTAILEEQESNSWKIIIIIEMAISQNFRIIPNPQLSISLCGINQACYLLVWSSARTKTLITTPSWLLTNVFWTFSKLFFSLKDFLWSDLWMLIVYWTANIEKYESLYSRDWHPATLRTQSKKHQQEGKLYRFYCLGRFYWSVFCNIL